MNEGSAGQSLTPIISEEEFIPILEEASANFLSLTGITSGAEEMANKFFYFTLLKEAEQLEDFLDNHGARSNKRFLFFAELVACVRNFCLAGFQVHHIMERYNNYLGGERDLIRRDFEKGAHEAMTYLFKALSRFNESLRQEAASLGINVKPKDIPPDSWKVKISPKLPFTIGGVEAANQEERLISIAQGYRRIYKRFQELELHRRLRAKSLEDIIPSRINETMMAEFEGMLHNVQSEYDTHIKGGSVEAGNEWSGTLRGLAAIPMHLFDMLNWLSHFYERHENQVRESWAGARVAELVDNQELLKVITNFGLFFCGRFLAEGNEVCERILSQYISPIQYELPIPIPQGFHARPSTYVSLVVREHGTDTFLLLDGKKYNCRSVLDLMEAGGALADQGKTKAIFEGDKRCLDDIKILSDHNYCEDEDIPSELNYIRIGRNM